MDHFATRLAACALALPLAPPVLAADATAPTVIPSALPRAVASGAAPDKFRRGQYLVETGGCGDCHTPFRMGKNGPEPDTARLLSGHPESLVMPPAPKLSAGPWLVIVSATNTAWAGPWGVSFTANLTPDADTGLGRWTARQFAETMRTGRHLGVGRPVLPPMPIPAYKNFTDADLDAIFGYLQSIPAIANRVPAPQAPAAAPAVVPK